MIDFKKLLPFLIIAVVIAAAGFGLYWQKQWQKTHIPLDISSEAVQAKCLEDVGKMTDEQLVEKINNLAFVNDELLKNINVQALRYLTCTLAEKSGDEKSYDENYDKIKVLVNKIKISEERKTVALQELEQKYKEFKSLAKKDDSTTFVDSLSYMLAIADLAEICPNKLPDKCLQSLADFKESSDNEDLSKDEIIDFCQNKLCNFISQYPKNKEEIESKVINFKNWAEDLGRVKRQFHWRIALVYRFGGKELSLKVCDSIINIASKEDCIVKVNNLVENIKVREVREEKCISQYKELENLICSVSK